MVKSFRSWESLALKLNHRMFCGRTLWWSGDTFLIYHLTSPVWRNGWQRITLCHHALPTFFGKRSCGGGNRTFLVCLVTSCDHVIWDHITLWMEELFTLCHHCAIVSPLCIWVYGSGAFTFNVFTFSRDQKIKEICSW